MSSVPGIRFTAEAWKRLQAEAEAAYPFEGCGLLAGPLTSDKVAQRIVPMKNQLREEGRGRFDFTFSPKEFVDKQRAIEAEGLDIVGIYHSHPDHPPRPSATDEGQPMLAGWVNVIASVHGGCFKAARAWWREDDREPFVEAALVVDKGAI